MKFKLEKAEVAQCLKFAEEAWDRRSQSKRDFGRERRNREEFIADQAEGKLAEHILKKFLKTIGIDINLDFNHYDGELNTDNGDLVISLNGQSIEINIDVKGSSHRAQWLLVEDYKFINRDTKEYVSKAFVMVCFGEDFPGNKSIRKNPNILLECDLSGEVMGWAKAEDFYENRSNQKLWFEWRKGNSPWHKRVLPDLLPADRKVLANHLKKSIPAAKKQGVSFTISVPLKASLNYGLPIKWLRKEWEKFASLLLNDIFSESRIEIPTSLDFSVFSSKEAEVVVPPRYSFVICARAASISDKQKLCIKQMLFSGIKVILFTTNDDLLYSMLSEEEQRLFIDCHLLSIQTNKEKLTCKEPFMIIDGIKNTNLLEKESKNFPLFNFKQYEIEHALKNDHLAVRAGAGTGKTMVMVQRVICLLQRDRVKPSEIAMITFTRESSKEMFSRLRKELFKRYEITKQTRYLTYIEELKRMRISTIHSFAKMILKETGSSLGYGRDIQVRTFVLDRKKIIENTLEKHLLNTSDRNEIGRRIHPLKLYELIDMVNDFWMEMEKKGMTSEDIASLYWGEADYESDFYNKLFKKMYPEIEERFQVFKQEKNAVSMNDLTRQVDRTISRKDVSANPLSKLPSPIKHLFIDEFQDSDDVQIRLIAQIQQALNVSVFAVGDVKQSIYRFRGADHTAFGRLKEELEASGQFVTDKALQTNYRTTKSILNRMHPYFEKWGEKGWLDYNQGDELRGVRNIPSALPDSPIIFKRITKKKEETKQDVIDMIHHAKKQLLLDTESEKGKKKIAALVRTNKEAQLMDYWCKQHGITTYLNIGGTFFNSEAVHDFAALVEALLFPNRVPSIVNLLNTPYSAVGVHWTSIARFNGEEEKIYRHLERQNLLKEGFPLKKWSETLRITPVFSVIRMIIKESRAEERFYMMKKQWLIKSEGLDKETAAQQAMVHKKQYTKNINRIMDLLHQEFDSDFATLYRIYTWIKHNQAVNREEDEPLLDDVPDDVVNIITVHRSKGLEFHTVLIPFTDRRFRANFSEVLFDKEKQKAGWKIKKGKISLKNNFYGDLNTEEELAVLQEETRLLYVALTRSKNQLWILQNEYESYPNPKTMDTWAKLLRVINGGTVQ